MSNLKQITIGQRCREGHMSTEEFTKIFRLAHPVGTQCLAVGDYLIGTSPIRDGLDIERITELDYLEPGDFRTHKNTTGSISGNIFIRPGKRGNYDIMLGSRVYTGPGSVPAAVTFWEEMMKKTSMN